MAYELPELLDEPRNLLAPSLIGFLKIRDKGEIVDYPNSLGSGTFVRLPGDIYGVLTAAHVLDGLPEDTPIGVMIFTRLEAGRQLKIEVDRRQKVFAPGWTGEGLPDLGFLRLDDFRVRDLKALGCVFYDLEKDRSLAAAVHEPDIVWRPFVVGIVAESKAESRWESGHAKTVYTALFGSCEIRRSYDHDGCELVAVEVQFEGPAGPPSSYGGISGGALWAIAEFQTNRKPHQRVFLGVAYYEERNEAGMLEIICHTLSDVVKVLLPKVQAHFGIRAG
ncbi:hypothetical protein [Mesorhizobium sophorae]|uniref:hypothetical protein n=1 Tax=Mesorhizobium sophorae TaxID=1300294 RepID=UPI00117E2F26|nr:hypothetical protein [Mesorhizobium sophorae]